jgi:hypothetical protein
MALYGGVALQPGDLMEVEFQTTPRVRVAASVRDRTGYCFGLEFLGLLPSEDTEGGRADLAEILGEAAELAESLTFAGGLEDGASSPGARVQVMQGQVMQGEDEILALFLERQEAYLHQKDLDIQRVRHELEEVRQSRREIELLVLGQVLRRSE